MRTIQQNIDEWLRREAHVVAGHPFQMGDCSCIPLAPQEGKGNAEMPLGFFVTHGHDISFVDAETPEGEQILRTWNKIHVLETLENEEVLPGEYWYG